VILTDLCHAHEPRRTLFKPSTSQSSCKRLGSRLGFGDVVPLFVTWRAISQLWQRHLRGGAQIRDKAADLVVFEDFEQAPGHYGVEGFLAGEDLGLVDDAVLANKAKSKRLVVCCGDHAGEGAAIANGDDDEWMAFLHDLVGLRDLREAVVKIGPIRACEAGPDQAVCTDDGCIIGGVRYGE